jgi:transposase
LSYQDLSELEEVDLHELFTVEIQTEKARYEDLASNFEYFKKELTAPGCTLQTFHQEYILKYLLGYQYTQFTLHYRRWSERTNYSGKLIHKAAEQFFIDICGKKLGYVDKQTGELVPVEVFVAILPCSQYTFVKACMSQKREDTIKCLRDCLSFLGGVPQCIVSDNLKAAVTKAHRYAPIINKTLKDFALHYQCVVDPTRPYKPQDKAMVERAVALVYQRIYYPLSKQTFFSLDDLNLAIKTQLTIYNDYLFSHGATSRRQLFIDTESGWLKALPDYGYHIREYRRAKVQKTSHIFLSQDKNYYSVPYRYQGNHVEVQFNQNIVEVFYNYELIASHPRCFKAGAYTTIDNHMPPAHQAFTQYDPETFILRAEKIGKNTVAYIKRLLEQYTYPAHAYKQSHGILSLIKYYDAYRVENAYKRALEHTESNYHIIERIIKNGLDQLQDAIVTENHIPIHQNIRGKDNYQ